MDKSMIKALVTASAVSLLRTEAAEAKSLQGHFVARISVDLQHNRIANQSMNLVDYIKMLESMTGDSFYVLPHSETEIVDLYCIDCNVDLVSRKIILLADNEYVKKDSGSEGKPAGR